MSLIQQYRDCEERINARVRYHARRYRISKDDLSGTARQLFLDAVATYRPDMGASLKTWVTHKLRALNDECRKIALDRQRYIPTCVLSAGAQISDEFSESTLRLDQEAVVDLAGSTPFPMPQLEIDDIMEMLTDSAQAVAQYRMAGYNTKEIMQKKLMKRHEVQQVDDEIKALLSCELLKA